MFGISKTHIGIAVTALVAYAIVAIIQREVMVVPVVGKYLPGGDRLAA